MKTIKTQIGEMKARVGDVIEIPGKSGEWLVIKTEMTGGGTGHGPHDIYPDGWHVTCKKLQNDKPVGSDFVFTQSGCFNNRIDVVNKVGQMVAEWKRAK